MPKITITREAIYVSVITTLLVFILGVEWTKLMVAKEQLQTNKDMFIQLVETNAKVDKLFNLVYQQDKEITTLQYVDNKLFSQVDTIKISLADFKNGMDIQFINHEGRLTILEKNYND